MVCAKSPATGLWGESNCGGFWGPELTYGRIRWFMDHRKSRLTGLYFHSQWECGYPPSCSSLGKDTYSTQAGVKAELDEKNPRVAVIGPAGESLIPYCSDSHRSWQGGRPDRHGRGHGI